MPYVSYATFEGKIKYVLKNLITTFILENKYHKLITYDNLRKLRICDIDTSTGLISDAEKNSINELWNLTILKN